MSHNEELEDLRNQINNIDSEIIEKIAELIRTSKRIETYREGLSPIDSDNTFDEVIFYNIQELAIEYGLDAEGIERVFNAIKNLLSKAGRESS